MYLLSRLITATRCGVTHNGAQQSSKCISTHMQKKGNTDTSDSLIKRSVFVSQSTDVFINLAFEDWLYRNYDFSNHHVLFLWKNDPCIVFGRHQNPWKECNVQEIEKRRIALARRNSGGGTVYHDNGNLNLSFFTSREKYNRKCNLFLITRALFREWSLESVVNKREDIVVEGSYKVSGTAAKLGRPNAYHHCTLLVNVDKETLGLALKRKEDSIVTNATTSIRSPIKNLIDINSTISMDKLITAISKEYLRKNTRVHEDEEYNLSQEQTKFQLINPTESCFPGLDKLISEFRSWNWNFGKTPKFTIIETLKVIDRNGKVHCLNLYLDVQHGIVEDVKINLSNGLNSIDFNQDVSAITNFHGTRYSHDIAENIIATISCTMPLKTIQTSNESNVTVMQ